MNARPTCDDVKVLASEVALGIASGDERALVLAHSKSCGECRRAVEELSETADALLLLGPLHEPESGFESTVLAKIQSAQRHPTRLRARLLAVAAAAMLVTGGIAFWITSDDRSVAAHYRDALAVADGKYFGVVPLRASNGDSAGHLFAYEGDPTWVFLIFDAPLEPGRYTAELETRDGEVLIFGTAEIGSGDVTWGREIPVNLREVTAVRMTDDAGVPAVEAAFPSR